MRWFASLRRTSDFARLRRRGQQAGFTTLSAFATVRPAGKAPRVGITVSKGVGDAVVRNLVRRRIQGALDALGSSGSAPTPFSGDLLLVARPCAAEASYSTLAADVAGALARLGGPR